MGGLGWIQFWWYDSVKVVKLWNTRVCVRNSEKSETCAGHSRKPSHASNDRKCRGLFGRHCSNLETTLSICNQCYCMILYVGCRFTWHPLLDKKRSRKKMVNTGSRRTDMAVQNLGLKSKGGYHESHTIWQTTCKEDTSDSWNWRWTIYRNVFGRKLYNEIWWTGALQQVGSIRDIERTEAAHEIDTRSPYWVWWKWMR